MKDKLRLNKIEVDTIKSLTFSIHVTIPKELLI